MPAFFPYRELRFRWDLDRYGDAFGLEPYVRARWSVVAYHDAPSDWRDHVVLRRR